MTLSLRHGSGMAHGKFGELLQGALLDDQHFLVSLPTTQMSMVNCTWKNTGFVQFITPPHKTKTALLVKMIMDYLQIKGNMHISIQSQIAEGKGLGSSTADLLACARAISDTFSCAIPEPQLLSFLATIEPTDGTMYDELVCFDHRRVELHERLGKLPNLYIIGVDEGGMVDTIQFNREQCGYTASQKQFYVKLLSTLRQAIQEKNLRQVGEVATQSALMNQARHTKQHLPVLIDLCNRYGCLGVVAAHSGTYVGVLLDPRQADFLEQRHFLLQHMCALNLNYECMMTLGYAEVNVAKFSGVMKLKNHA